MKYRLPRQGDDVVRHDALIEPKLVSPQGAPRCSVTGEEAVRFPTIVGLPEVENVD
jgi:hypothetical protein